MVKLNELTWKDFFGYHKPDEEELNNFIKEGYHIVSCDASYKNGIGTCSIQIRNGGKENTIKNKSFNAIGPNESEIRSILQGIREAKKCKSIKKALFTNDNLPAISFVTGGYTPKQKNIVSIIEKVKEEIKKLLFPYEFALVRGKVNRRVDKSAKKYLTRREGDIEIKIKKRIDRVNRAIERSKNLGCIKVSESEFVVSSSPNRSYVVNLKELGCTCPFWTNKWGGKEKSTIFSRALPCKHLCKAGETSNQNILDIFHSQIFRRK